MADQPENKVVDKRVVARYLRKGLLDPKDHERFLKGLSDLAGDAIPVEASMEHVAAEEDDEAGGPA